MDKLPLYGKLLICAIPTLLGVMSLLFDFQIGQVSVREGRSPSRAILFLTICVTVNAWAWPILRPWFYILYLFDAIFLFPFVMLLGSRREPSGRGKPLWEALVAVSYLFCHAGRVWEQKRSNR